MKKKNTHTVSLQPRSTNTTGSKLYRDHAKQLESDADAAAVVVVVCFAHMGVASVRIAFFRYLGFWTRPTSSEK